MSNEKTSENLVRRKSKVSWARVVLPGLVGPKLRLKSVDDGQQVNIPVPVNIVITNGETQEAKQGRLLDSGLSP
jgi:hypothetical protein